MSGARVHDPAQGRAGQVGAARGHGAGTAAPGGYGLTARLQAKNFTIHLAIPNDKAILRVAIAMISHAQRTPAPGDSACFEGRIGRYGARFNMGRFFDSLHGPYRPSGWKTFREDEPPSLYVGHHGLWSVRLHWHDGFDAEPTWDRTEYFSALVPGLTPYGELFSDLAIIHAAELKRYEELSARQSAKAAD
jgi:hypothetical protein